MRPSVVLLLTVAALTAALPVVARATHKPGHQPGQSRELTISANPITTVFRGATVLSGRLKGPNSAGTTVTLRADAYPFTGDAPLTSAVTDSSGAYRFTRRPTRNTLYRAAVGSLQTGFLRINVRIRVSVLLSDSTPRAGQLVRFSGRACPTHDGLVVHIKRKTSTGAYRDVRHTALRDARRCSVYSRRFRVFRDGRYRVFVDDADHARGISIFRDIDAHP